MPTRRAAIQAVAAGLAVAGAQMGCSAQPSKPRRLQAFGLQLSTITPLLLSDFPGTLAAVADIGYRQVEFSALGFLGRDVSQIEALLDEHGLAAPVGRISPALPAEFFTADRKRQREIFMTRSAPDHLLENIEAALPAVKRLGQKSLVLPALSANHFQTMGQLEANVRLFEEAGRLCAADGVQFGYHNHDWELKPIGDVVPYDFLIENTNPEAVTYQIDAYWIVKGGGQLDDYLSRFAGRFSSCHMKDIDDSGDFADVGSGNIDFPAFTRQALAQGATHFFVERDGPPEPMDSARRSYAYLSTMEF